jgi:hypothetical protein
MHQASLYQMNDPPEFASDDIVTYASDDIVTYAMVSSANSRTVD